MLFFRRIIYRGETCMRLTDLNIIDKAAKLVRDKFNIDFAITQCSKEAQPADEAVGIDGTVLCIGREPELKIESVVVKNHGDGWIERVDLGYTIYGKDLEDGSLIDELIGGDLKKHSPNMRQTLRLAFILFDGIRYAMTGETKKAYMDKGWLSRVVCVKRQSHTK